MKYTFLITFMLLSFTLTGCSNSKLDACLKENAQLKNTAKEANVTARNYRGLVTYTDDLLMTVSDDFEKCKTHLDELKRENAELKAKRQ